LFIIKVCIKGTFHLLADFFQTKFNLNNKVLNDNFLKTVAVQNLMINNLRNWKHLHTIKRIH